MCGRIWDGKEFGTIRRSDVTALMDGIEDQRGARQADAVLAILRGIANWHATRHDNYVSPFTFGMRRQAPVKRDRVLSDAEIKLIWCAAATGGTFGAILQLALLTAQRREKLASMRWAAVADGVWTVAAETREKGAGGALKLPGAALAILNAQPRIGKNPFVFAGRGGSRFNGFSKCKAAFDATLPTIPGPDGTAAPVPNWTVHDLRRTARSLMSRAGVRPDIAERVLGHVIAEVEGVYDRHRYDDEKADALARLAVLLRKSIINPPTANVVLLEGQR